MNRICSVVLLLPLSKTSTQNQTNRVNTSSFDVSHGYYEDITYLKDPICLSFGVFFVLTKKGVKEGAYPLHRTHLNLLSNEMKT
jgi:hypothetical protein